MDKIKMFKYIKNIHRIVAQMPVPQHWKSMVYKELTKLKEAIHS